MSPSGQPDIVNCALEGIACGVYRSSSLDRLDGKAAERVVALIEEFVETEGAKTARRQSS